MPVMAFGVDPRSLGLEVLAPRHLEALRETLGPGVLIEDPDGIARFSHDETEQLRFAPGVAALPASVAQVQEILRIAHAERLPVVPRGAGTGLSGGALPVCGGIVLSLERLDRIRDIDERDLVAEAESGVVTARLQAAVEEKGLFYPPDPASRESCTLGGNLAEDSAGPRSCKYGTTRKWVLGLEAVSADGTLVRTGSRSRKDATGYSLTQLLIGSEGTLAVITAATLRLTALPRATLTAILPFPTLESAASAVERLFVEGIDPAACELLEAAALAAVGRVEPLPEALTGHAAMLLVELDGESSEELLNRAAKLEKLARSLGGGEVLAADDHAGQRRLWQIRRKVGEAVKQISTYKEADTVVPRSRLVELVREARQIARAHGLTAILYGHAGDGNLHVNLLRGALEEAEWERRRDAAEEELFRAVVGLGGRLTGEHGVGWTQRHFLPLALSPAEIERPSWDQARLRSGRHPEPGQDPAVTFPTGPSFDVGLAFLLGMAGQVLARHLRVPGIVVLLAIGVGAGPDGIGLLHTSELGAALPALVSFAVSIILFEGALALDLRDVWRHGGTIRRLITFGALTTAVGAGLTVHLLLGWEGPQAVLFGTLVVVTGPTVIQPILRRIRVQDRVGAILEGEAILGDAVGATLAVLALELVLAPSSSSLAAGLRGFGERLGVGALVGLAAGGLIALGLRFEKVVPLEVRNGMALALVVGSYQVADAVRHESGIVAAIVAGLLVGNLPVGRRARGLHEFKEELTTLLLGLLFVLLAADVRLSEIGRLGWAGAGVVATLMFVVRPANVWLSTLGSDLSTGERWFLSWLAPRGIVAAAVASYFAEVLTEQRLAGGGELRALVFLVIAVTVTLQGLTGGWVARRLGVARPPRSGWAILGANGLALAMAKRLGSRDEIVLIDSSHAHCRRAREHGFRALESNGLEEETLFTPEVESRLHFLAVTPNEEVNFLFARRVHEVLRGSELWIALRHGHEGIRPEMLDELRAQTLFGGERRLATWALRFDRDLVIVESRVAAETTEPLADSEEGEGALLPLVVHRDASRFPYVADYRPKPGDRVEFALFSERRDQAEDQLTAAGWLPAATPDGDQPA